MTPTNSLSLLESLKFGGGKNVFSALWLDIISILQPLVMIIINFTIIPLLIDLSISFEDYETKSQMENVRIGRIYFFMILNIILIPVTAASSALALIKSASSKTPDNWGNLLAANLMSQ